MQGARFRATAFVSLYVLFYWTSPWSDPIPKFAPRLGRAVLQGCFTGATPSSAMTRTYHGWFEWTDPSEAQRVSGYLFAEDMLPYYWVIDQMPHNQVDNSLFRFFFGFSTQVFLSTNNTSTPLSKPTNIQRVLGGYLLLLKWEWHLPHYKALVNKWYWITTKKKTQKKKPKFPWECYPIPFDKGKIGKGTPCGVERSPGEYCRLVACRTGPIAA